jgi:hypothetical protein
VNANTQEVEDMEVAGIATEAAVAMVVTEGAEAAMEVN